MKPDCDCTLCELALRVDIAQVFVRSPQWLGVFQVRSRINWGFASWEFFTRVWVGMLVDGLIIESFAPDSDEFPRYLLCSVMTRPVRMDRGHA